MAQSECVVVLVVRLLFISFSFSDPVLNRSTFPTLVAAQQAGSVVTLSVPAACQPDPDVFLIPYGVDGQRLPAGAPPRPLDLRCDRTVTLTQGPHKGDRGVVVRAVGDEGTAQFMLMAFTHSIN